MIPRKVTITVTMQAKLGNYTVYFHNSQEYHVLKQEIFTQDQYYFETDNPAPVIIDAGAHIGLATLYFKKLYPAANVIAIEPLPANFQLLEKNLWENQLENVETHQLALADRVDDLTFYADSSGDEWFSTAGVVKGAWNKQQTSQELIVPTLPLTNFLNRPVDFLKLDIEGSEQKVLQTARHYLHLIKHMMIEFHPTPEQSFKHVIDLLEEHNFKITLWQKGQEITKYKSGLVMIEAELI